MQEKHGDKSIFTASDGLSEKPSLSVTPSLQLECLSPYYDPKHIQKIAREGIFLSTGGEAILIQIVNLGVGHGVGVDSTATLSIAPQTGFERP